MMASIDNIANVQIALKTATFSRANFGIPLLMASLMSFSERVRAYSSYAEAEADKLPPAVLTALSDGFAQIPRPPQIKVGRRAVLKGVIKPSELIPLGTYSFSVNGEVYSYTADSSPTAAEIATGLAAAVTADTDELITATAVSGTVEIAYNSSTLAPIVMVSNMIWDSILPLSGSTAIADDLAAINNEDPVWYGLIFDSRTAADILKAAEWVESNEKLYIGCSSDSGILSAGTTTDVASTLKNSQYYRSALIYHTNAATEYPDMALASRVFTIDPGGETWALKQLASITPSKITTTERNAAIAKNANLFEYYSSDIALTAPGKVAAGEWIDVIRFRDWLKNTIQTNLATMMINRDKIPYTDPGIQVIVNNLRRSLQEGQNVGGIAPDELDANGKTVFGFTISYPRSQDIPANIKATRVLTIGFQARLAGAIHQVTINGSLAYELQ